MRVKVELVLRCLLAISLIIFGLNKFLNFIPSPALEGTASELMDIYVSSGFMKMIGVIEMLAAISFLTNKYLPISLVLLVAIVFNAVVFHILHDLEGLIPALIALTALLLLIFLNKPRFKDLLTA